MHVQGQIASMDDVTVGHRLQNGVIFPISYKKVDSNGVWGSFWSETWGVRIIPEVAILSAADT